MAGNVVRGTGFPLLQNETWDSDPSHGYTYRLDYKGISQANMLALQQDYVRSGIACRLTYHQGGTATLEVEDSTQQYTLDNWQIIGDDERIDLFTHPKMLNALSDVLVDKLITHAENGDEVDTVFGDPTAAPPVVGDPLFTPYYNTLVMVFYGLYRSGAKEFENDAFGGGYVLLHTTNAPNRWGVNISDFGVGKIYTTAELLSEVQNSGLWSFPLPGRQAYKLGVIPSPAPRARRMWGWKKSRSNEITAANNRIEISQRYVLSQWQTDVYDPF